MSDDAKQFKPLTERLALCWIHEGRHYERLSPIVPSHKLAKEAFLTRFWTFYGWLQAYRRELSEAQATKLRAEFTELFATKTGYDDLAHRILAAAKLPPN